MDNQSAQSIALQALVWVLADNDRAQRLLAITGLTADDMRASVSEPWLLGAALSYLEGYEPDLIKCCHEIAIKPEDMVAARRLLTGEEY